MLPIAPRYAIFIYFFRNPGCMGHVDEQGAVVSPHDAVQRVLAPPLCGNLTWTVEAALSFGSGVAAISLSGRGNSTPWAEIANDLTDILKAALPRSPYITFWLPDGDPLVVQSADVFTDVYSTRYGGAERHKHFRIEHDTGFVMVAAAPGIVRGLDASSYLREYISVLQQRQTAPISRR